MKRYEVRTDAITGLPGVYEMDDRDVGPCVCVVVLSNMESRRSSIAAEFARFLTWRQWRTDPPPENALVLVQYRTREGTRIAPGSSRRGRLHVDVGDVTDDLVGWRSVNPEEEWPIPKRSSEGLPAIDRILQDDPLV